MTTVKLYWSNICVFHRMEMEHLNRVTAQLAAEGIRLEVRHFGIGYPCRMAEYLGGPDAELPDLIVSTDLEVFEDGRIYGGLRPHLHPLRGLYPLKPEIARSAINAYAELLPFLVIPLVLASKHPAPLGGTCSLAAMIEEPGVAFGGIDNSGAKAVIKTLWDRFGEAAALRFAQRANILPMPINAFQAVRTGAMKLAIAPSIYTRTADGVGLHRFYPREGAIAIPAYAAASRSLPMDVVRRVLDRLLSADFLNRYVIDGDLCCALAGTADNPWVKEQGGELLYPSPGWFAAVDPARFEAVYRVITKSHTAVAGAQ